jgi:hypothetical protein
MNEDCECELSRNLTDCGMHRCQSLIDPDAPACDPETGYCSNVEDTVCEFEDLNRPPNDIYCYRYECDRLDGQCHLFTIGEALVDACGNCLLGGETPPICAIDDNYQNIAAIVGGAIIAVVVVAVVLVVIVGLIGGRKIYDVVNAARATDISAASSNPLYQEQARGGDNPLHA